jgi:ABC-type protease/lipase transport system fused ATPase/permease subunit
VLDEPNAHLDAEGEEALSDSLKALKQTGSTIVIVAHRLSPLAHVPEKADQASGRSRISETFEVRAVMAKGLVMTSMPGSSWPFPTAAFSA